MKEISMESNQFKNLKNAVERNKFKNKGISIDIIVETLMKNGIKLSNISEQR